MEWKHGGFTLSDNSEKLNFDSIFQMLSNTYWASERPRALTETSIKNSLCFGMYQVTKQIGFARVVTDYATFSYLCDVIIHSDYRGNGLGKWMLECILEHPALKDTRQYLSTKDAHGFYEQSGFKRWECMRRDPREYVRSRS